MCSYLLFLTLEDEARRAAQHDQLVLEQHMAFQQLEHQQQQQHQHTGKYDLLTTTHMAARAASNTSTLVYNNKPPLHKGG